MGVRPLELKSAEGGGSEVIGRIMRKEQVRNEREFIDTQFA